MSAKKGSVRVPAGMSIEAIQRLVSAGIDIIVFEPVPAQPSPAAIVARAIKAAEEHVPSAPAEIHKLSLIVPVASNGNTREFSEIAHGLRGDGRRGGKPVGRRAPAAPAKTGPVAKQAQTPSRPKNARKLDEGIYAWVGKGDFGGPIVDDQHRAFDNVPALIVEIDGEQHFVRLGTPACREAREYIKMALDAHIIDEDQFARLMGTWRNPAKGKTAAPPVVKDAAPVTSEATPAASEATVPPADEPSGPATVTVTTDAAHDARASAPAATNGGRKKKAANARRDHAPATQSTTTNVPVAVDITASS